MSVRASRDHGWTPQAPAPCTGAGLSSPCLPWAVALRFSLSADSQRIAGFPFQPIHQRYPRSRAEVRRRIRAEMMLPRERQSANVIGYRTDKGLSGVVQWRGEPKTPIRPMGECDTSDRHHWRKTQGAALSVRSAPSQVSIKQRRTRARITERGPARRRRRSSIRRISTTKFRMAQKMFDANWQSKAFVYP